MKCSNPECVNSKIPKIISFSEKAPKTENCPDCKETVKQPEEELLSVCPMCELGEGKQSLDKNSPIQPYYIICCEICGYYISGFRNSELVKLWETGETNE